MTDLFDDNGTDDTPVIDPNKDYFSELVGEGKKYKDPVAAGRALVEKDVFIERLKAENAGIRQELNTRLKLEEVVDRISSTKSPNNEQQPPREQDNGQPASQKTLSPEDVQSIVTQTMTESQKAAQRKTNVEFVERQLEEAFGPTFRRTVKTQAAQLGLGEEFLKGLAADQPNAFLKLMGVEKKPEVNSTAVQAPRPSVSSDAIGFRPQTGIKGKSYYDNIKKNDPRRYWTPAVQNEMHAEALKQGWDAFSSR
jgi:hypothetical protein